MSSMKASDHAHIVIVGGSLTGVRAAVALRDLGFTGSVTIVDRSEHAPYDRPPLSKGLLTGAMTEADIRLPDLDAIDVTWQGGRLACGLSTPTRSLYLDDGGCLNFDGLILATGVRPKTFGAPGPHPAPLVLRSLAHARTLRSALTEQTGRLLVIGAGFIGTEVAAAARSLGWEVTIAAPTPVPLYGALGSDLGRYVASLHRDHGVDLRLGVQVTDLHREPDGSSRATFDDESSLNADVVVTGLGSRPNTEWLEGSQLLLDDGVRTDQFLRALDVAGEPIRAVTAAGDLARAPHPLFGPEPIRIEHWSNAIQHGRTAARTLLADLTSGIEATTPTGVPSFWSDQYDTKILSVGLPHLADTAHVIEGDPETGAFVVGYGRDGLLVGAAGIGSARSLGRYRRAISRGEAFPPSRQEDSASAAPTTT